MKVVLLLYLLKVAYGADNYIIGGTDVDPVGKWPWQGSLNFGSSHYCGAVLIENPMDPTNNEWALTASHCAENSPSSYTVYFGTHDRGNDTVGSPEEYGITQIIQHPDWLNSGGNGFPNDIALIRLDRPASTDNKFIAPIVFSNSSEEFYLDYECWISGWGATVGGGSLPIILQEVQIPTLGRDQCEQHWEGFLNHGHICVMDEQNQDRGACNGDSGGPLQCTNDDGSTWVLAGLTSWGRTGCATSSPSVYNRVGWYSNWVKCLIELDGQDDSGLCYSECPCDSAVCEEFQCKLPPS